MKKYYTSKKIFILTKENLYSMFFSKSTWKISDSIFPSYEWKALENAHNRKLILGNCIKKSLKCSLYQDV